MNAAGRGDDGGDRAGERLVKLGGGDDGGAQRPTSRLTSAYQSACLPAKHLYTVARAQPASRATSSSVVLAEATRPMQTTAAVEDALRARQGDGQRAGDADHPEHYD